jgi:thymidylate synthase (FAD)
VNIRALRHVIAARTDAGAENEIRRIFDQVAQIMVPELPGLLGDFVRGDDGTWSPEFPKV